VEAIFFTPTYLYGSVRALPSGLSQAVAAASGANYFRSIAVEDIQLPGFDGLEATRRIRESEADGGVPIIAFTSYAMTGDREKALEAGCTGYIEKPLNPETFMGDIEKHLRGEAQDPDKGERE